MEGNWNDTNTHVSCFRWFQWPEAEFIFSYILCRNGMPVERNAYAYITAMNAFSGDSRQMQWREKREKERRTENILLMRQCICANSGVWTYCTTVYAWTGYWDYNIVKHSITQQSIAQHTSSPRQYIQFSIRLSLIEWSRINFIRWNKKFKKNSQFRSSFNSE